MALPFNLASLLAGPANQQGGLPTLNFQSPQASQPQQPMAGNASLSQRIQELLGAKDSNQGGKVQDILSARFEPDIPDIANAQLTTLATGKPTTGEDVVSGRMQDMLKQLSLITEMQKASKPDLPQGYQMNQQTGQAELIPGVDPSFGRKMDPYGMPVPVLLPNGQPGFAPRTDLTKPGFQPLANNPNINNARPPSGYKFGPPDDTGTQTLIPISGGPADPSTKPVNEYQGKSGLFAARMEAAQPILDTLGKTVGTDPVQRAKAEAPLIGNYLVSSDYQQVDQAERNFVNATLRQESGASINPSEFANAVKQYFPRPGDGEAVLEQKRQNRAIAVDQMKRAAGPAYKSAAAPSDIPPPTPDEEAEYMRLRGGR